jgi:hypothetical protein
MAETEPDSTTTRVQWIEAIALGLLAALPVVPYLSFLVQRGVPRFGLFGDFALLEHATRHVWSGDTLLGPYSRFHWHHPGPLFFYFVAPFQALFGSSSTGLYVGTCFVNAASAAAIVVLARLFAGRAHAAAALFVVIAWFAAFGNISANPWNPLVIVLPMMAYLLAAAMFAHGKSGTVYPAVVFGALVTQTHVAAVTTVLASGSIAVVAFLVRARRERQLPSDPWLDRAQRRRFASALAVLVVLFAPPIVEQLTASKKGNLTRIADFFVHRPAPLKPLKLAAQQWVTATSWLPDRVLSLSLADEGYIPMVMRWDAVPEGMTAAARTIAIAHVALVIAAAVVATRRKDVASLSILAVGAIGNAVAVTALQAIVGVSYHYLVFWTTAGSTIAWIGILSTACSAVGGTSLFRASSSRRVVTAVLILLGLVGTAATTTLQRGWFTTHPVPPASRPIESADLRAIYEGVRQHLGPYQTAVVHTEGAWDMAYATVLELEKDRTDVRVPTRDAWIYAGVRTESGLANPVHVWFSTTPLPLPTARCLDLVTKSGDISVYVARTDLTSCPP